MKTKEELRTSLRAIDHKSYPAYKSLAGSWSFGHYTLNIEHVQGDPFAAPSQLSVTVDSQTAGFPAGYWGAPWNRTALEDYLLRRFGRQAGHFSHQAKGSGKSGVLAVTAPGQEVLERTDCEMRSGTVTLRFEAGFPANGRTINARELEKILFDFNPVCVDQSLLYANTPQGELDRVVALAEDQRFIRQELERISTHKKRLQAMRRNSFWVMSASAGRGGNASGDIVGVLMDYVRMVFHVDLIKFNRMLKFLRDHVEDVDALIGTLGYLETTAAVWIFRQSLNNGWCVPEFAEGERISLKEGYHPLLHEPVKNSITAERGVLLTGSNASGKSTFLKTVAVNAVLAQTVHTCAADGYSAPFFHVYSSMALRDDLDSGESYYIVEIKALKRILDAAAAGERPVLCFVDEVLRGTNTVERIAASTQILQSLGSAGIFCFAATHDIELTDLLGNDYDNYHFEEDVREGDIFFSYRLYSGKATTRNAIRLLELMGYDEEIIERASRQAEHFLALGEWKLT